ncbi:hypothetical protein DDE82_006463 [Stemphylium lycopersici]|nr:hypothetical protein DDE82_006463 [Stemphylium lycopersici]
MAAVGACCCCRWHPRPFLTTIPFIARDFASWGFRVDHHASNSLYIAEVQLREKIGHSNRKERDGSRRTKLMAIWASEIVERKRRRRDTGTMNTEGEQEGPDTQEEADSGFGNLNARIKRAGDLVQDFLDAMVDCGECGCERLSLLLDSKDAADPQEDMRDIRTKKASMAPSAPMLVAQKIRFLTAIRYYPNAVLPAWSNPDIIYADQVILEYHPFEMAMKDHLVHALSSAIGKDEGRMGRVERCALTGTKRVYLWVDVGPVLIDAGRGGEADVEDRDPVPRYERGEGPPLYAK